MNTSEPAVIIVDSASLDFAFQGDWYIVQGTESNWQWPYMNAYRNTNMRLGGFTFTFEGFDAMFVGASRQPVYTTFPNSTITIDPDSQNPLVLPFSSPDEEPYYLPWFKTPTLPYGTHRVVVTYCSNEMVNYALVTVGRETSLEGRIIFVDDADPQIHYEGIGWKQNHKPTFRRGMYTAMPAANTTMETNLAEDSFSLSFLGTSATVYGIFSWSNLSSMILQFDLDGQSTLITYPVLEIHSNYWQPEQINIPFMSYNDLSPNLHHLMVTVKEISNTTFRLDYVTYAPAFSNLASLSSSQNSTIVFTPVTTPLAGDEENSLLKIVVGSVLGGLVILAIAVSGLVFWNRHLNLRGERHSRKDLITPFPAEKAVMNSSPNLSDGTSSQLAHQVVAVGVISSLPSQSNALPIIHSTSTKGLNIQPPPYASEAS